MLLHVSNATTAHLQCILPTTELGLMTSWGVKIRLEDGDAVCGGGCDVTDEVEEFAEPIPPIPAVPVLGAGGSTGEASTLFSDFFSVFSPFSFLLDDGESDGDEVPASFFFDEPLFESFVRES